MLELLASDLWGSAFELVALCAAVTLYIFHTGQLELNFATSFATMRLVVERAALQLVLVVASVLLLTRFGCTIEHASASCALLVVPTLQCYARLGAHLATLAILGWRAWSGDEERLLIDEADASRDAHDR
jgi:hypothetical protein